MCGRLSSVSRASKKMDGGHISSCAFQKFDIDVQTGFLPNAPLARLSSPWETWETILDDAMEQKLQLGSLKTLTNDERTKSEEWRSHVRDLPILKIDKLKSSDVLLSRAHHVLSFILHFYVHTLPPTAVVKIPPPLSLPLLQVSAVLELPPTNLYADVCLNNWRVTPPNAESSGHTPTIQNIRCRSSFTGTRDEEEFFLDHVRIELRGGKLLQLMHTILLDMASAKTDCNAVYRVATSLRAFSRVISELRSLLLGMRNNCNPDYFYKYIRPWLRGDGSGDGRRSWYFEGLELDPALEPPNELCGSSAAQTSLIQSLDIFLGVDGNAGTNPNTTFIQRMRRSMPRRHRDFLNYLETCTAAFPLRDFVTMTGNSDLLEAYNGTVRSLKEFRDAHLVIITMYILGPARRLAKIDGESSSEKCERDSVERPLQGTAGTDLVRLLKGFRDYTAGALIGSTFT